ncbi:16S rRNA (guanine(966)-N(2))-methyltransferase RsmD [Thermodesulfobacterium thermophilum]|uniref:16S rRNA (guanine(966)-N(2))-methyltransferase RsmD n=1 Tax=Thermodesulfobacterium thermophilum TaxID=886 RepID=UPI0003B70DBA|nr:16S rRNA (guanine(966)-N(2))-methyltransferase RsmD [Thermodesulfobacterium thermophilum]
MKITGGYLKGQKLFLPPPKDLSIRPLRSRIRKSLFDLLGQDLSGSKVLDLFSGTGALGIEALSRGADLVFFVDFSDLSLSLIRKNLEKLKLTEKALVLKLKLPEGLSKLSQAYLNIKFDLVFITPPYKTGLSLKTLKALPTEILDQEAIIMVEEATGIPLPEKTDQFVLIKVKTYGETTLYFYQPVIPNTEEDS